MVVVDDAWTIDHADAFSVTAPPARLLITTRNNEVLVGIGAEEHRVDVLSLSDALKMLAEWVGQKSPDKLPPEAAEVAKECGYLPLALAMIGAMIRLQRPAGMEGRLTRLQRADLESDQAMPFRGYPYPDLLRAIEVSVEALEPLTGSDTSTWRYSLKISRSPKEQACSGIGRVDTRDCMDAFAARSLATVGQTQRVQEV